MIRSEDLVWLWSASKSVDGGAFLRALKRRADYVSLGARLLGPLSTFRAPAEGTSLQKIIEQRPALLGAVMWPYQCAAWPAETRLARIAEHYALLDEIGAPFPFGAEEKLKLLDLGHVYPGCAIVLDQPAWFMREGGLVLNIFVEDFRCYSLAFSLQRGPQAQRRAFIGCIQGRNDPGALDLYRDLTKAFHGMRPRDLLLELFRVTCKAMGVGEISAVADACRHHRHPYFGEKGELTPNYDDIWRERGGAPESEVSFRLSIEPSRRPLEEVKPNKRSLFRKRYRLLDELETALLENFLHADPIMFADT